MSCDNTTRTPITSAAITARFTGCLPSLICTEESAKKFGNKKRGDPICLAVLLRHIRLVTGLVLFAYVTTHLLNHACGLLGLGLALRNSVPGAVLMGWIFLLAPLPYYLVTVQARFRHPIEPLIAILGVYLFRSTEPRRSTT